MIKLRRRIIHKVLAAFVLFGQVSCSEKGVDSSQPNVVIIYADDLGYGDVSAYGATEINTPGIDRIATEGRMFTQGYSTSGVCTPSRYALLTGEYPFRRNASILPGNAPLIIDTVRVTLPKLMKQAGYATGVVGKWHLGLGNGSVDWNKKVKPGPNEVGFDYSYIMAATNDRVPCVYLENGNVDGLDTNDPITVSYKNNFPDEPTGKDNPELLKMHPAFTHDNSIINGISRIGYMKGGKAARWIDENMADTFLEKSVQFIKENKENPFFLYYALHQPHVPRVPHQRFAGKSGMGPRGDAILEADWCVQKFLEELDRLGLAENTIIIFSSDNGPVLNDGYWDQAEELVGSHTPAGILRGGKASLFEGGTRVPFIIRWPGRIEPGKSEAIVCQMDLLASFAKLLNTPLTNNYDSQDLLEVFTGKTENGRNAIVLEGVKNLAIRKGEWVFIPPYKGEAVQKTTGTEMGRSDKYQLYNLRTDVVQQKNQAKEHPEKVLEMKTELEKISAKKYNTDQ